MTKTFIKGALVAAVAFAATPAMAAPTDFTAKAVIIKPLTISKNSDLTFGTTTMNPTLTSATVSVAQASGSAAVCSDTVMLTCSGGGEASFTVNGVGTQSVNLDFGTVPTQLDNDDGSGAFVAFTADTPGTVALTDGVGTFYVGGTITVDKTTTTDGSYTANLTVTASFQ